MESTHPSLPEWQVPYDEIHRAGNFTRANRGFLMARGIDGAIDNYQFRAGGEFQGQGIKMSPRHRHNFAQIRHPMDEITVESKDPAGPLHAEWVGYYPEACYYGPTWQRSGRKTTVQYGGPSGLPYLTRALRAKGKALCLEEGKFVEGIFTWTDEDGERHNQDGYEAVWEHAFGQRITYPEPLYDKPIFMNPDDYEWEEDKEFSGVERKTLGEFERDTRIGFVRLEPKSSVLFGTENSNEVLFLEQGSLSHEGTVHLQNSGFTSAAADEPEILTAVEPCVLYYVKMPTFSS